ncbi:alpha-1,2-mannosidase family protein [Cordyceps fumosorosea ARSEF 2679]|uniref:Alpha-1,2-mannosidase family protein n=1 Tax=Cordyceps fumosorosea (strain ARSEF 2679) TaxID=1081104 RepID=A0A167V8Q8_CORFA|nr:alpha-1,2-mannosidase family protein [Cordyceps fumosorosea ARSEF 2679]OAA62348.1 alpha-1,2-mannosidase family protein [Cordyceps fumosorosea ARSEF 2679]
MSSPSQDDQYDVYPVHLGDAASMNEKFVSWLFRFNDVLDVDKLHLALAQLLEHGDWRKLGGRLHRTSDGKLELRVPRRFTSEQPAVAFTKQDFSSMSIGEHSLAKHFPEPRDVAYSQSIAGDMDFRSLAVPKGFPSNMKQFLATQAPQIALLTTSFKDATLVSVVWPHTLFDGVGLTHLLHAWSLQLAGKDDEIPRVLGAREDALDALETDAQAATGTFAGPKLVSGLNLFLFIVFFLWHRLFYRPRDTRMIFLPRAAAEAIYGEAKKHSGDAFITQGDALSAWVVQRITAAEPAPHPVTVMHLVNGRGRLSCLADGRAGVYLQNIVSTAFCHLGADVIAGASVGAIAVESRRQVAAQTTEAQMTLLLRRVRESLRRGKRAQLEFLETLRSRVVFTNNLTRAAYVQTADFGPAVVRRGEEGEEGEERRNPEGTMVNYLHLVVNGHITATDNFYIIGKDHGENYWLMVTVSDKAWTRLDESIASLGKKC